MLLSSLSFTCNVDQHSNFKPTKKCGGEKNQNNNKYLMSKFRNLTVHNEIPEESVGEIR